MDREKKIAVVGIGGVGGYLAGMLCHSYDKVTLVARKERKAALEKQGLILHSEFHGEIQEKPYCVCTTEELEPQDYIFLCVKNYSLKSVCEEIAHAITENTVLIPVMNGVDPGERTRQYIGKGMVIDSLIYIVSFANSDYSITQQGKFADIYLGKMDPDEREQREVKKVFELLKKAGINVQISTDIQAAIWKKYMVNCGYNVATSFYEEPIGMLRADPIKAKEYESLVKEAYQIAKKKGVRVGEDDVREILHKFYHEYAEDATSSLMRDVMAGRRAEIETFSGYIVEEGRREEIPVPVSEKMYRGLLEKTNKK